MIDFSNVKQWNIGNNEIIKAELNNVVVWEKPKPIDYTIPFYVENTASVTRSAIIQKINEGPSPGSLASIDVYKSDDMVNWSLLGNTSNRLTISLDPGDKVYLRASASKWGDYFEYHKISGIDKVGGNIMSLLYGENFTGNERTFPLGTSYNFSHLFYQTTGLKDVSSLLLPATSLTRSCYSNMFASTGITSSPKLPATTLNEYCYYMMFRYCTSLTTAPALPATTLAYSCYLSMFQGCTSLTTAPSLPATTLADYCYSYMFKGCTVLTTAPALPATTLVRYCYTNMFGSCTSLTTAPALPATTLAECCYKEMFIDCTALNHIKCLATNISATDCIIDWVSGVAASGTFVKHPNMSSWPTGASGIPSGWTVEV